MPVKIHQIEELKLANFVVCKIYFNKADQKEITKLVVEETLILTIIITESLQWVRSSTHMGLPF